MRACGFGQKPPPIAPARSSSGDPPAWVVFFVVQLVHPPGRAGCYLQHNRAGDDAGLLPRLRGHLALLGKPD